MLIFTPQTIATAVAVLLVVATGAIGLLLPGNYAPLYVAAAVLFVLLMIGWVKRPLLGFLTAFWLVFLPLGLIPAEIHSFLNRLATIGAVAAWCFTAVSKPQKIALNPAILIMAAFLVWGLMTAGWSSSPSQTFYQFQIYALRWLLFLCLGTNFLNESKTQMTFMRVIALNGWILMGAFIFTLLTTGFTPGARLKIAAMNENESAVYALLFIPAILWSTLSVQKKVQLHQRLSSIFYMALTSLIAVMSASRGSILSLVILMLGFLFIRETRLYPLLGIGATALVVLFFPQVFSTLLYRLTIESSESLLGGREAIWKAAMRLISEHGWVGVGLGNAPTEIIRYLRYFSPIYTDRVALHNPLLTIWAESGLIGLILYSGVLGSSILIFALRFVRALHQGRSNSVAVYGVIGVTVLAYLVSWFKGGGSESEFAFFLALVMLNLPLEFSPPAPGRAARWKRKPA